MKVNLVEKLKAYLARIYTTQGEIGQYVEPEKKAAKERHISQWCALHKQEIQELRM